jgi:predicted DNA-binding protein (UPF0251 family)
MEHFGMTIFLTTSGNGAYGKGISRATFGRIVQKARKNTAEALVKGLAIRLEGMK